MRTRKLDNDNWSGFGLPVNADMGRNLRHNSPLWWWCFTGEWSSSLYDTAVDFKPVYDVYASPSPPELRCGTQVNSELRRILLLGRSRVHS